MKILLVDDEKISLENLADAVSSAKPDAELHAFLHADEALSFAARVKFDIAILDISMRDMDGIETAEKLREISPDINIIFATGYSEYMPEAFSMHASGYMMKPITTAKVLRELSDLRHPVRDHVSGPKRVRIQTFGNFEVFIDEQPVRFQYNKTREMLAYLTDRSGAFVTNGELMGILWEDSPDTTSHSSYLRNLKTDLMDKLDQMETLVGLVEARYPEIISAYEQRLKEKISSLLEDSQIDESRLAAEVVLFADKLATDEETVRLRSHIDTMRRELGKGNDIGRKLDFIAQEMNREANTILSKANDLDTSNYAIDLKTLIEKIREQVQNIE